MKIRDDLTKDPQHIDYIIDYEELDSTYSQLHLDRLHPEIKGRYINKYVMGEDDKLHPAPLYVCTEIYCSFDIETSTVFGKNIVNDKYGYYSVMYLAQFGINGHVVLFRHWNDVVLFLQKLPKLLRLSPCTCLMVWVHNLDYENSYIKHRLDIDGTTYFGKNKQHPIKYLAQNHYIFHDSYSVTNSSLLKLGQMYNTKHQKAAGDLDHNVVRNSSDSYKLNDRELGYASNDVLVLTDFSRIMFEEFYKKRGYIPDTATQILSKELQENAVKYAEQFLGHRSYENVIQKYDVGQYKYMLLKRIHGKIFGFQFQEHGVVRTVSGMVDPDMFCPFDDEEKQLPPEGKKIGCNMRYDMYRWLFRGGYTKSNARYTTYNSMNADGVVDVLGVDYTSSYPFVQTICNYPMSEFWEVKMTEKDMKKLKLHYGADDFEKWRYIFIIELRNVKSIDDFALESLHKAKVEGAKIIDNGRIRYAQKMTVCLTDCDYALYKMYYKWDDLKVIRAWKAEAAPLPDYFLHTIWTNGVKKQTLKCVKGMEVEYMLAKGKFNSGYGLCCKQPVFSEYKLHNEVTATGYHTIETVNHKYFGTSEIFEHSYSKYQGEAKTAAEGECKEIDFSDSVRSSILSPFWGIWVSAFARYNLLSCMKKVSDESEWKSNDVVYCDTDSMYMLNGPQHQHIIDDWNGWAAQRVAERLPEGYEPLRKLGQIDNIALDESGGVSETFDRFKTLGAKRYVKQYVSLKKHNHIKTLYNKQSVTVAGLPKGTLENYCKKHKLNIFDEFRDELDFSIEGAPDLVKLASTYHDEVVKIMVNGELMEEYSSCTLYPSTFKISLDKLYRAYLHGIIEQAGSKVYAKGALRNE